MPLAGIVEKVESNKRLSFEDGVRLSRSTDLLKIGELADLARKRKAGNEVYFIANRHIYYSNVCLWLCRFCAFSKSIKSKNSYTKSVEEITNEALEAVEQSPGLSEFRITGGIHPDLSLDYFEQMLDSLKRNLPNIHIEAFAPTEVDYIADKAGKSPEEVLERFKAVGLGALACGGAEVFSPRVRQKLCPKKSSGKRWLEIMEIAHNLDISSNASLLYGHIETIEERIDHLIKIRELQDKTNGFKAFLPLPFIHENSNLKLVGKEQETGYEQLKMIAVSRLMLDNFKHIKVLWMFHGIKLGQVSLSFGANDLGGTVQEQKKGVARSAGADADNAIDKEQLEEIIKDAGRVPVERGVLYNRKSDVESHTNVKKHTSPLSF